MLVLVSYKQLAKSNYFKVSLEVRGQIEYMHSWKFASVFLSKVLIERHKKFKWHSAWVVCKLIKRIRVYKDKIL